MGLMDALYVGSSGLQVSQNALNATGHNLANVETKGYVRQQTVLKTRSLNTVGYNHIGYMQTGRGVNTAAVLQVRDSFLDKSYRREIGRQGFYDSQYDAVNELEDLFGELEGVAFQDSLKNFWTSLQEISKEPDSLVAKSTLVQTAVTFAERADSIYNQLSDYQLSLNTKIQNKVDRINEIGQSVQELNKKIMYYESNKIENANDLRDQRNKLIDELSQMVDIAYNEDVEGRITINVEGAPFVTEDYAYPMKTMTVLEFNKLKAGNTEDGLEEDTETNMGENSLMLIPVWPALDNAEVFNFDTLPKTENNTDIGGLKGLLLARGTKVANYTDIPVAPKQEDYTDGSGYFDEVTYNDALLQYEKDVKEYNAKIDPSIVMSSQAMFDQLIHGIVTTINDILSPNKEVTVPAGTTVNLPNGDTYTYLEETKIKILDKENAPVSSEGEAGIELFMRKSTSRYLEPQDIVLSDGTTITGASIYNEEDPADNYSLYTLGEIRINQELMEDASKVPLNSNEGTGDFDIVTAEKLASEWQKPFATLNPNSLMKFNFNDYYMSFTGNLATIGEKLNSISSSQDSMVNSIENQRLSVHSVSSDDELTNLIKFQHAYNASSRYINVIDEMLEHIVTRL